MMDIEKLIQQVLEARRQEDMAMNLMESLYAQINDIEHEYKARLDVVWDLQQELGRATKDMPDAEKQAVWARVRK